MHGVTAADKDFFWSDAWGRMKAWRFTVKIMHLLSEQLHCDRNILLRELCLLKTKTRMCIILYYNDKNAVSKF